MTNWPEHYRKLINMVDVFASTDLDKRLKR